MTNPSTRTVELEGGEYTLSMNLNTMIWMEEQSGASVFTEGFWDAHQDPKGIRFLLHAMLRQHHPDLSEEEAGNLITPSNMRPLLDKVAEVWFGGMPTPDTEAGNSNDGEVQPDPTNPMGDLTG